ncbi:MAG: peptide chain release factor N(5)-glutamine methyltransferase [Bacteroidota bacterium]
MQLKEIKTLFHVELSSSYPREEIDSFFFLTVEHFLDLPRFILAIQPEHSLTKEEGTPLFETLAKLKTNEPIQYILGETEFMGMSFVVNASVLIPRPETEELVRWIVEEVNKSMGETIRMLDIGTGSGCIAVSLAKNLPNARLSALDVSEEALLVAQENAKSHQVEVSFQLADVLDTSLQIDGNFNVMVSNPPYVRELEQQEMKQNVTAFEPHQALYVSDDNPLVFYKSINQLAKRHLTSGGMLFYEINQYLANEMRGLMEEDGFSEIEIRKDIFGNFRMLKATWAG